MEDMKKSKLDKFFLEFGKARIIGAIIGILLVLAILILANVLNKEKVVEETSPVPNVAASIVPAPNSGERYTDIPKSDKKARQAFVLAAKKDFNISPNEKLTPSELAKICAGDATAQIQHLARTNEAYQHDREKILEDVQTVNENCWAKYGDKPFVKPESPKSHINHQTFEPTGQSGHQ